MSTPLQRKIRDALQAGCVLHFEKVTVTYDYPPPVGDLVEVHWLFYLRNPQASGCLWGRIKRLIKKDIDRFMTENAAHLACEDGQGNRGPTKTVRWVP